MKVWLTILNKNLDNNNTPSEFVFDENCIYTNNYNETLDSFSGRISHINEIDIEPYDKCVVSFKEDDGTLLKVLNFCVDTYTLTQDTIGIDNEKYSYNIELFSQTKLLEGIICPNLSITPYKLETGKTRKSILYYLQLYLSLYGEKTRIYDDISGQYYIGTLWRFAPEVVEKFTNVDAPEMQWNAPTLREVFNDLMMVKDCIPVLNDNVISFIDLTQKRNPITDYNFLTRTQSADNYVSEIKMNLQNVMQTQLKGVKNTCSTSEYLTFTSDSALITSDNIILKTTYPILNIKHLWMGVMVGQDAGASLDDKGKIEFYDLCDIEGKSFIKEYSKYITMPIYYDVAERTMDFSEYQNYNIYFTRGSNVIAGFTELTKKYIFGSINTFNLIRDYLRNDVNKNIVSRGANTYFSTFFKIEYETMADQVFTASKDNTKNKRVIVDNQTNSWVDAYSQGFLEYQKANRLGNQIVMYNQRVININNAIQIGDYKDDNIVYQTQYQIYQEHIEVNAYATKNYILRNYWTGVNSKIRTWVNAQDEALIRHELEKYYCCINFLGHQEKESYLQDFGKIASGCIIRPTNDKNKPFNKALMRFNLGNNNFLPMYNLLNCYVAFDTTPKFVYSENASEIFFEFICPDIDQSTIYDKIILGVSGDISYREKVSQNIINVYSGDYDTWLDDDYRIIKITSENVNYISNPSIINYLRTFATITGGATYYYQLELLSRVMGNSMVFTTGFNDNYSVGKCFYSATANSITTIEGTTDNFSGGAVDSALLPVNGGIPTQYVKYVDDYGEFSSCELYFYQTLKNDGKDFMFLVDYKTLMANIFKNPIVLEESDLSPKSTDMLYQTRKEYHKDNKEILKISTQFEYYSENDDIHISDKLANNNFLVRDVDANRQVKVYLGNNLDHKASVLPSGAMLKENITLTNVSVSNGVSEVQIRDYDIELNYYDTMYITDENDNILIGINIKDEWLTRETSYIYLPICFSVLKDRDLNIYNTDGIKIGTI